MKINKDFWLGKKVFVTGAGGFIGTHLVNLLMASGSDVRGYIHESLTSCDGIVGDLSKSDSVEPLNRYLLEFQPDVIFHLAAQPLVNYAKELLPETMGININGSINLFTACEGIDTIGSIIHISTDKVYGNIPEIGRGSIPYGIEHPYNLSKLVGDFIAQLFSSLYKLPMGIVRNGNIYGAGDNHFERIIPSCMEKCLAGEPPVIRGSGSMTRDYIHVSEIIIGFMNAAEYQYQSKELNIFLMGSKKSHSVAEVLGEVWKSTGVQMPAPIYEPELQGEIQHQHIQDSWTEGEIGWNPEIDLSHGLELSKGYYQTILDKDIPYERLYLTRYLP